MVKLSARHSVFFNIARKRTCSRCLIDLRHKITFATPSRDYCLDCAIITNQLQTFEEFQAVKQALVQVKKVKYPNIALSPLIDSEVILMENPDSKNERNHLLSQYRALGYDTETANKKKKKASRLLQALKKTNRALVD